MQTAGPDGRDWSGGPLVGGSALRPRGRDGIVEPAPPGIAPNTIHVDRPPRGSPGPWRPSGILRRGAAASALGTLAGGLAEGPESSRNTGGLGDPLGQRWASPARPGRVLAPGPSSWRRPSKMGTGDPQQTARSASPSHTGGGQTGTPLGGRGRRYDSPGGLPWESLAARRPSFGVASVLPTAEAEGQAPNAAVEDGAAADAALHVSAPVPVHTPSVRRAPRLPDASEAARLLASLQMAPSSPGGGKADPNAPHLSVRAPPLRAAPPASPPRFPSRNTLPGRSPAASPSAGGSLRGGSSRGGARSPGRWADAALGSRQVPPHPKRLGQGKIARRSWSASRPTSRRGNLLGSTSAGDTGGADHQGSLMAGSSQRSFQLDWSEGGKLPSNFGSRPRVEGEGLREAGLEDRMRSWRESLRGSMREPDGRVDPGAFVLASADGPLTGNAAGEPRSASLVSGAGRSESAGGDGTLVDRATRLVHGRRCYNPRALDLRRSEGLTLPLRGGGPFQLRSVAVVDGGRFVRGQGARASGDHDPGAEPAVVAEADKADNGDLRGFFIRARADVESSRARVEASDGPAGVSVRGRSGPGSPGPPLRARGHLNVEVELRPRKFDSGDTDADDDDAARRDAAGNRVSGDLAVRVTWRDHRGAHVASWRRDIALAKRDVEGLAAPNADPDGPALLAAARLECERRSAEAAADRARAGEARSRVLVADALLTEAASELAVRDTSVAELRAETEAAHRDREEAIAAASTLRATVTALEAQVAALKAEAECERSRAAGERVAGVAGRMVERAKAAGREREAEAAREVERETERVRAAAAEEERRKEREELLGRLASERVSGAAQRMVAAARARRAAEELEEQRREVAQLEVEAAEARSDARETKVAGAIAGAVAAARRRRAEIEAEQQRRENDILQSKIEALEKEREAKAQAAARRAHAANGESSSSGDDDDSDSNAATATGAAAARARLVARAARDARLNQMRHGLAVAYMRGLLRRGLRGWADEARSRLAAANAQRRAHADATCDGSESVGRVASENAVAEGSERSEASLADGTAPSSPAGRSAGCGNAFDAATVAAAGTDDSDDVDFGDLWKGEGDGKREGNAPNIPPKDPPGGRFPDYGGGLARAAATAAAAGGKAGPALDAAFPDYGPGLRLAAGLVNGALAAATPSASPVAGFGIVAGRSPPPRGTPPAPLGPGPAARALADALECWRSTPAARESLACRPNADAVTDAAGTSPGAPLSTRPQAAAAATTAPSSPVRLAEPLSPSGSPPRARRGSSLDASAVSTAVDAGVGTRRVPTARERECERAVWRARARKVLRTTRHVFFEWRLEASKERARRDIARASPPRVVGRWQPNNLVELDAWLR